LNEEYLSKVAKIAQVKYEIEYDVVMSYKWDIEQCYDRNFTPRRTVELIAERLFT